MTRLSMLLRAAVFTTAALAATQAGPTGSIAVGPSQSAAACEPQMIGAVIVNYCPERAPFYGGYTTHRWQATVYPGQNGLGVLTVTPDGPVNPADWRLSVNGRLFAPERGPGLRFEGLPLPADAAELRRTYHFETVACRQEETSLDCLADGRKKVFVPTGKLAAYEYRWEDWPSAIRGSAYAREHIFLVYQDVPLALPSVLDDEGASP